MVSYTVSPCSALVARQKELSHVFVLVQDAAWNIFEFLIIVVSLLEAWHLQTSCVCTRQKTKVYKENGN